MKLLLQLFGLLTFCVTALAQQPVNIESTKYYRKDKQQHEVSLRMSYLEGCPAMEQAAAKFLFKDSVSSTLKAALNRYAVLSGSELTETRNATSDFVHTFSIELAEGKAGKYACYLLKRAEKRTEGKAVKTTKNQWNLAYDIEHDRVLTIDDVMVPAEAAAIKAKAQGKRVHLLVSSASIAWGYLQKGKLTAEELEYADNPAAYQDSFKQLVGPEHFKPRPAPGGDALDAAEVSPSFPGGEARMQQFLLQTLDYPDAARQQGAEGDVEVMFIVEPNGAIIHAFADKNANLALGTEAVRAVKAMPRWMPGEQDGKPARVRQRVSVRFRLTADVIDKTVEDGTIVVSAPRSTQAAGELFITKLKPLGGNGSSHAGTGDDTDRVYDVVEQMPSFPGGAKGLFEWLSKHIKYPPTAEKNGIKGRVITTFVVERDGSITNVEVFKKVHPALDREAVRVVKSMPKWNPGKQNGSSVRVKYNLPITFRLQ